MDVCTNPDVIRIMMIINNLLLIVKIALPLILIIMVSIDMGKTALDGDSEKFKSAARKASRRVIAAIIVFFIPTVVNIVIGFVENRVDFMSCFEKPNEINLQLALIRRADTAIIKAEQTLDQSDYEYAYLMVSEINDGIEKNNYKNRLAILKATLYDKNHTNSNIQPSNSSTQGSSNSSTQDSSNSSNNNTLTIVGSYASDGTGTAKIGVKLETEPDPSAAVNYWKGTIDPNNFIYPKDEKTQLPLGAWPKNYKEIPTQISNYKTYVNGIFIFPTTPVDNDYRFVYEHNGIDIMAEFGTPIYSPVDGTINYSEWGHTKNRGGDETAYTVSIELDNPVNIDNKNVQTLFLTHMCGIRYRCKNCNQRVKKGELIGFVGNASGTAQSVGWAPHLHMTIYPHNDYNSGLKTSVIETMYNIPPNTTSYNIKVGE